MNYVVELQSATLAVPYIEEGCNSGACALIYEIALIGSETVAAGGEVECDGDAHLFIDSVACDGSSVEDQYLCAIGD